MISVPKEILIYNKNDLSKPIVDGTIIDEGNYVLHQNKEVIKTNKLYELEYQYLVQEPSSYISNSYENGQILFGRVNKLSMKLCHEFCETCNELGISNNKQYCLSCLEPYTYDYFSYFNIFESNCVPEGYYNDRENNQLVECNSVIYKYYYNKTDNNKFSDKKENLTFINIFKNFILELGVSDKKFYEQCVREIIYNKKNFHFNEFLDCFKRLLNLKYEQTFLKYKFLFQITPRKHADFVEESELQRFYDLVGCCKKISDKDLLEKISNFLVSRYKKIFPKDEKLYTRKITMILELFFDIK
jgi:hypothetical protein